MLLLFVFMCVVIVRKIGFFDISPNWVIYRIWGISVGERLSGAGLERLISS
jgi:hypothetical protein